MRVKRTAARLLALSAWVFCLLCAATHAADSRSNFLIIVADDLCFRDLGYEGNPDVKTPNLNKLHSQSMHLQNMFSPATSCSPARHALFTGLYPIRSGAYPNHTRVHDGTKSLFTHLKTAGYRVALQNKEHIAPPASFPYEHIKSAEDLAATTTFITRDAAQPWLLVFASDDPHAPWTRGPKYAPAQITVPPYMHDNAVTRQALAKYYGEISKLDEQVGALMKMLENTKQSENTVVLFVSEQGGSLPYAGKCSVYDNGIRVSALLRWPGKVAAGSTSSTLMQYVDIPPTFLEAAGIDPTKIDVGCPDANVATGFDGRSFFPVLLGKSPDLREYIFAQHTTWGSGGVTATFPIRAVRDKRYKLIRNLEPDHTFSIESIHENEVVKSWQSDAKNNPALAARVARLFKRPAEELYDLNSDPFEEKNLAADPALAEVKTRLQAQLDAWMAQQGDKGVETEKLAKTRQVKKEE